MREENQDDAVHKNGCKGKGFRQDAKEAAIKAKIEPLIRRRKGMQRHGSKPLNKSTADHVFPRRKSSYMRFKAFCIRFFSSGPPRAVEVCQRIGFPWATISDKTGQESNVHKPSVKFDLTNQLPLLTIQKPNPSTDGW